MEEAAGEDRHIATSTWLGRLLSLRKLPRPGTLEARLLMAESEWFRRAYDADPARP